MTSASALMFGSTATILPSSMRTSALGRLPSCGSTVRTWPPWMRVRSAMCGLLWGRSGVEVGLRLAKGVQRAAHGPVAATGDEELLGRKLGDDFAAVGGD